MATTHLSSRWKSRLRLPPRGRVALTPSGEIVLTLLGEIKLPPEKQTFFRGFLGTLSMSISYWVHETAVCRTARTVVWEVGKREVGGKHFYQRLPPTRLYTECCRMIEDKIKPLTPGSQRQCT